MAKLLPVVGEVITAVESAAKLISAGVVLPFDEEASEKLLEGAGQAWVEYSEQNAIACGVNMLIAHAAGDDDIQSYASTTRTRADHQEVSSTTSARGPSAEGESVGPHQVVATENDVDRPNARIEYLQSRLADSALTFVSCVPIVGHIKGIVHYCEGDEEAGVRCMHSATRPLVVFGAAAAMVATCGAAAPIAIPAAAGVGVDAGLANDGVFSAVDRTVREEEGHAFGVVRQIEQGIHGGEDGEGDPNAFVNATLLIAGDALAGAATAAAMRAASGANAGGGSAASNAASKTAAANNAAGATSSSSAASSGSAGGASAGSSSAGSAAANVAGAAGDGVVAAEAATAVASKTGAAARAAGPGIGAATRITVGATAAGTRILAEGLMCSTRRERRLRQFGADSDSEMDILRHFRNSAAGGGAEQRDESPYVVEEVTSGAEEEGVGFSTANSPTSRRHVRLVVRSSAVCSEPEEPPEAVEDVVKELELQAQDEVRRAKEKEMMNSVDFWSDSEPEPASDFSEPEKLDEISLRSEGESEPECADQIHQKVRAVVEVKKNLRRRPALMF
mmetsp:Transcript_13992/g.34594  ORF Transcript_13992/g.34594 Transcript_13992/m.34594 type:complete len:564 (+) Transcript_13992:225-1916(+)|eukprot:CAMPEP_0178984272 /NCGR_PEP_ID=MMETSP0795-20121207/1511_1 /TAXON_ID=88552 /ORGANISM="Amoebophrya sp., Strain Ameob2" /LENGTH=563 /DNA_ID=CAMNT_0020675113 /DNA_START=150 /DNA_END=1841 /DNA_ORIENTATION=-